MMPMGFECPAETRERKEGSNVYPHPVTGRAITYDYGLNWYTHGKITGNQSNIARSAVKNPAKLIRMTEGTKFALHVTPESATERHGGDPVNVLFEDGHIEFIPVPYKDSANFDYANWRN
jgi:prepilin-type processing-associated H-X9-DG protein